MATYKAPLRDMRFVLHELLGADEVFADLGYEEVSADLIDAVLEEGAKLCEQVVFPTNRTGDLEGCRLENGAVRTPTGFREAYARLREGGWIGLAADPQWGGQGLPGAVGVFFEEMLQSANVAFALYPGLTRGAYVALDHYGTEELKRLDMPKLGPARCA